MFCSSQQQGAVRSNGIQSELKCAKLLGSCGSFLPAELLSNRIAGLYDKLEEAEATPPPTLMDALICALSTTAEASHDISCLRELLQRLYSRRYGQTFSNPRLLLTLREIEVGLLSQQL